MFKMLSSSRRLTLILLITTTCAGFLLGKISADMFMGVVLAVVGFFFGQRSSEPAKLEERPTPTAG